MIGTATVTRSERNFLKSGDPVFQGDIIETTAGGEVDICFADGTTFSLSNSAQMALKEFPNAETARPALFDIARGDFAFIAGEKAKTDRFEIETPFARIRGRTRVGGIGTLSLISLFFATMEELQAAPSDAASTDDGIIIPDYKDESHGSFELITKEAVPRRIYVDDPGVTWSFRFSSPTELSVNSVTNSPAQMTQLSAIQQSVLHTYEVGLRAMQGPTFNGQNGSATNPNEILPSGARPINFTGQPDAGVAGENLNEPLQHSTTNSKASSSGSANLNGSSDSSSLDDSNSSNGTAGITNFFVPASPPPPLPPPPPAPAPFAPTITTTAAAEVGASSINIGGTAAANSTVKLFNNASLVGTTSADSSGNWQINNIALSDGANYSFTATATDSSGNTSSNSNALALHDDQTPPNTPLITTIAPTQNNAAEITIAGTAEANSKLTFYNNGNPVGTTTADNNGHWSVSGTPLISGTNNSFTATATDAANNTSGPSNALVFHDDQSPPSESFPTVTLTSDTGASNADFITSNGGVHFAGTIADTGGAGIASVQVFNGNTLLGTANVVAGSWSLDTTLAAGTYSDLKVTATDVAGNASTTNSVQTIIVDSTPPAAGTLSFANLTDTGSSDTPPVTTDNSFNLALTGPESGASIAYQVSLNGGAFTNTTASQSGLADGNYQFRALVTDAAGNSSTSNVITVVIDSTPPAAVASVTALSADTGTAGDFITNVASQTVSGTFTGALGAGEKIQVSANGGTTWVDATVGPGSSWSASGVTLSAGTGTLLVQSIDTAGNATAGTGHSYTLQTSGPSAVATVTALSADTARLGSTSLPMWRRRR